MNIQEFLRKTTKYVIRPHIKCKDGFEMSVQASKYHYCTPRMDLLDGDYSSVEIGFPSEKEDLLIPHAEDEANPTDTVYGYVPIEIVNEVIKKHGGMINQILI